jgi:hypothetical protein
MRSRHRRSYHRFGSPKKHGLNYWASDASGTAVSTLPVSTYRSVKRSDARARQDGGSFAAQNLVAVPEWLAAMRACGFGATIDIEGLACVLVLEDRQQVIRDAYLVCLFERTSPGSSFPVFGGNFGLSPLLF